MLEGHHLFGPQGYLAKLRRRRHRTDAPQVDFVYAEGVGRAEGAAHVVGAADVVQHQHYATFGAAVDVFIGRQAAQFYVQELTVFHSYFSVAARASRKAMADFSMSYCSIDLA